MKQIDFVDQAQSEQPAAPKTPTLDIPPSVPVAPAPAATATAAKITTKPPRAAANRRKSKVPAKPPRKNRPVGGRDDVQRLNMEVPRQLHKRLKLKAIYEDRTVTDIVLQAINDYLNSH